MQKLIFCLFILLLFSTLELSAQTTPPSSITKGRLYTTEGFEIKFRNLKMDSNTYRYDAGSSTTVASINDDKVLRIEQESGTNAALWGLGLGISGFIGVFLGAERAKNNTVNRNIDKGRRARVIGGYTAGCTLVGIIIGSFQKKYTTVYENPAYKPQSFHFDLIPMDKGGAITLMYRF